MCFYINKEYHPHRKALIAQEDILVYKKLIHVTTCLPFFTYKSPYFPCFWCPSNGKIEMESTFMFENGAITKGIHAYQRNDVRYYDLRVNVKQHYAIIPKGTLFYIGYYSDIVSHKLIVFEKVEDYVKYKNIKKETFQKNYKTPTIKTYIEKWLKPE